VSTLRPVFALRKRAMSFRMFHFMAVMAYR
jgi:hypothetical protein